MSKIAKLFTTVTIEWRTPLGYDCDCDVEVDYTFDGENLNITKWSALTNDAVTDTAWFDEQVWEAVNMRADEAYAERQADYGEYLRDAHADRIAA